MCVRGSVFLYALAVGWIDEEVSSQKSRKIDYDLLHRVNNVLSQVEVEYSMMLNDVTNVCAERVCHPDLITSTCQI